VAMGGRAQNRVAELQIPMHSEKAEAGKIFDDRYIGMGKTSPMRWIARDSHEQSRREGSHRGFKTILAGVTRKKEDEEYE
jgi:hypothetical protein